MKLNLFDLISKYHQIINDERNSLQRISQLLPQEIENDFSQYISSCSITGKAFYGSSSMDNIYSYQIASDNHIWGNLRITFSNKIENNIDKFFLTLSRTLANKFDKINTEKKIFHLNKSLNLFQDTASLFFKNKTSVDFYHTLGIKLSSLIPDAHFLILSWDSFRKKIQIQGFESSERKAIERILGESPIGMNFPIDDIDFKTMQTGRLIRTKMSLSDFTKGVLTSDFTSSIEQTLSIKQIYSIALKSKRTLLGNILILCPSRKRIENKNDVLILAQLAGISMQRFSAESELFNKQATLDVLLNQLPHPVFVENSEGTILNANKRFSELFPDTSSTTNLPISTPEIIDNELFIKHLISKHYFLLSQSLLKDNYGKMIGNMTLLTDITKRFNSEKELKSQRELFKTLFSYSPYGILIVNKEAVIVDCNHAQANLFSSTKKSIRGTKITDYLEDSIWLEIKKFLIKKRFYKKEINLNAKSSLTKLVYITVISLPTYNHYMINMQDITKLRNQELFLRSSQKMQSLGAIAAGITHEVNSPTQFISDNIHFLQEALDFVSKYIKTNSIKDDSLSFYLEEIPKAFAQTNKGIWRIQAIVKSMRHIVHPDMDNYVMADLHEIILDTIILTRHEWKYCAKLHTNFEALKSKILCYPALISQALMNLIINSAQAIKEKLENQDLLIGEIQIRTKNVKNRIRIEIIDNGIGILDKDKSAVFTPFFTTKKQGEGTGQGLPITHNIIKQHKGSITFISNKKRGTIFRISLPLMED